MDFFNKPIPSYIYKKSNITLLVIFTALFALVFINWYEPFMSKEWYPGLSDFMFFFYSSLLILVGVVVVAVSRILLYQFSKKYLIKTWMFILWILGEIAIMSAIYTVLSFAVDHDPNENPFSVMKLAAKNTALVLLIPYAISLMYFSLDEKSRLLKKIREVREQDSGSAIIPFYDEKCELRLSIKKENLLYIESADNYVNICYSNKDKVSTFLLRNTLKNMEDALTGTNILRCHRSFIVNFDHVAMIRRGKDGVFVEFDIPGVNIIPVSKSYSEKVTAMFINIPR